MTEDKNDIKLKVSSWTMECSQPSLMIRQNESQTNLTWLISGHHRDMNLAWRGKSDADNIYAKERGTKNNSKILVQ